MVKCNKMLVILFVALLFGCLGLPQVEEQRVSDRQVSAVTSAKRKAAGPNVTNSEVDLLQASFNGRAANVRDLVNDKEFRSNLKEYGSTALLFAAVRGNTETVRALVDAGVDVNRKTIRGGTALMWAAGSREISKETVGLLIKAGADVNAETEEGRTALMDAAMRGNAQVVQLLLKSGAKVNEKTTDGSTALTDAIAEGHSTVVQLLRGAGARE